MTLEKIVRLREQKRMEAAEREKRETKLQSYVDVFDGLSWDDQDDLVVRLVDIVEGRHRQPSSSKRSGKNGLSSSNRPGTEPLTIIDAIEQALNGFRGKEATRQELYEKVRAIRPNTTPGSLDATLSPHVKSGRLRRTDAGTYMPGSASSKKMGAPRRVGTVRSLAREAMMAAGKPVTAVEVFELIVTKHPTMQGQLTAVRSAVNKLGKAVGTDPVSGLKQYIPNEDA